MSATIRCGCGKLLAVREDHAGRRIRCPGCGAVVAVPGAVVAAEEAVDSLEEVEPAGDEAPVARAAGADEEAAPPLGRRLWYCLTHGSLFGPLLLVALLGPVALVVLWSVRQEYAAFARAGVPAEAAVTGKTSTYSTRSRSWTYTVRYRYAAADGRPFEGEGAIPQSTWEGLKEGDRLAVRTLPGRPERSIPEATLANVTGASDVSTWILAGVGAFAALGVLGAVWSGVNLARRVRLFRTGQRVRARVTEVFPQYRALAYRYWDADGGEHLGRTAWPGGREYKKGDTLPLVVDPGRPARHEVDVFRLNEE